MAATMLIAVPTGIKIFSWCATLWGGKLSLNTSLLFGIGFLSSFLIGGLTGIMLASVPFDIHVHDTYFVVGHFHYVLFGGTAMALFAAVYHWFPKMTGRMYNETLGRIHFVLSFIGLNLTFMPMHELGLLGMNRRIALYDVQFQDLNVLSTAGAYILGISSIPFAINMVWSAFKGQPAGRNPWRALTLEWQTSSPPIIENFEEMPILWSRFFGLAPTITVLIWKNQKQRNQYKISSLKWAPNRNNQLSVISYQLSDVSFQFTDCCLPKKSFPLPTSHFPLITEKKLPVSRVN